MSAPQKYIIELPLDKKRMERVEKEAPELKQYIKEAFGGLLKLLEVEVTPEQWKRIQEVFPPARTTPHGTIEQLPKAFKDALFDAVVRLKRLDPSVIDEVWKNIEEIKKKAYEEPLFK